MKMQKGFKAAEIKKIQDLYTDEKKILELALAKAETSKDLPASLKRIARELNAVSPKKVSK